MPRSLIYLIYNLLLPLLLVVGIPGYIRKGLKRGNLKRNFRQRFGTLPDSIGQLETQPIWFHAVSVGEVLVAAKIIRAVHLQSPDQPVVLTTTTTTGYAVAEKELSEHAIVIHNPVDLLPVVKSVVDQINPKKMVLVESEIWPNLVNHLKKRGIPVLLANARLSPRSERRYTKVKGLISPIFSLIDRAAVPYDTDIARWSALGIDADQISVMGSVKFDESVATEPTAQIEELAQWLESVGCARDRRIFLAGSTHAGEEAICGRVWKKLVKDHPDLALVIVPRHAERAVDFHTQLQAYDLAPIYRSGSIPAPDQPDVYVADTTGELRAWFHLASVVFIGKSLTGHGCQNPVEPIQAGKPVIVGPNTQNFLEVVEDLVAKQGISQVPDEPALLKEINRLLNDRTAARQQAENGQKALESHYGAAVRTAEWILQ